MKNRENAERMDIKVLVLEDSFRDMELMREQLTDAGYRLDLTHVEDEKGYTNSLGEDRFDLILSDFKLPGFDAFGALEISRKLCPDTPFICVSGSIGEETAVELLKLGAVDYVLKDRPDRLPYAVKKALEEAKAKADYRKSEEALHRSEEKYRSLFNQSTEAIYLHDLEGRFLDVNDTACSQSGYSREELLSLTVFEVHHRLVTKDLSKPQLIKMWKGWEIGEYSHFEGEHQRKDGSIFPVEISTGVIRHGDDKAVLVTIKDITERKQAEEKLLLQSLVLNQIEDRVTVTDLNGIITYINDAEARALGYSRDQMTGNPTEIFGEDPEQGATQGQIVTETLEKGSWRGVVINKDSNGRNIYLDCRTRLVKDNNGKKIALAGISTDITERRRTEKKLAESEKLYRRLAENVTDIVWTVDLNLNLTYISPSVERITGFTREEYMTRPLANNYTPDSLKKLNTLLNDEMIKEQDPECDLNRNRYVEVEHYHLDGSTIWVGLNITAIRDKNRQIIGFQGVTRDITDRKQAEKELLNLKAAMEQSFDGIALSDLEGKVTFVNSAWADMHGYSTKELLGKHLSIFHNKEQLEKEVIPFNRKLMETGSNEGEVWHTHKDGTIFPTHMVATVVKDSDGNPYGLQAVAHDITERKKAEQALVLSQKQSAFLAQTAFELIELTSLQEIYSYTVKKLYNLFEGHSIVALVEFDDQGNRWRMKHIEGIGKKAGKLSQLLGFDINRMEGDISTKYHKRITSGKVTEISFDFAGLTNNRLSAAVGSAVKKMLSIDKMYCIAFGGEEQISGNITFITNKNTGKVNTELIESFVLQVATFVNKLQAEKKTRENEKLLNSFFSSSMDGFFFMMLDKPVEWNDQINKEKALDYILHHQRMTKVNQAMLDQYRATESELLGATPYDLFKHDFDSAQVVFRELFDKGKLRAETNERRSDGSEMIVDGDYICLYDDQGRVIGHFGIQSDVTERKNAEAELRDNRNLLESMFESIQDGISVLDKDMNILLYNKTIEKWFRDKMPITGEKCFSIFRNREEICHNCPSVKCLQTGEVERAVLPGPLGTAIEWLEAFSQPLIDKETGETKGVVEFKRDITERLNSARQLKESQERLQTLISNTPVVIYSYKIIDGKCKFTYYSDTVTDILGRKPDEMLNMVVTPQSCIHPDDRQLIMENDKRITAGDVGLVPVIEYRCRHKDGSYRWLSDRQRVVSNSDGVVQVIGSFSDITEIKEYDQKLKETIADLNRLSEQSRSFSWKIDETGTYTFVNDIVKSVLGYKPADMIGKKVWEFHPQQGREEFKQEVIKRLEKAAAETGHENPMINKNGDTVWVTTTTVPLFDKDHKHIGFQGIDTDITQRKQVEEEHVALQRQLAQSQKMEAIGSLAGGIAHDFNNTLSVITGLTELSLLSLDEGTPLYKKMESITDAAQRSTKLVQQLLAFARKQPVSPQKTNINHKIEEMLNWLKRLLGSGITVQWKPADDVWDIMIDPVQFDQIIMNLAVNAKDAMEGRGSLTIETANIESAQQMFLEKNFKVDSQEYVLLKVTDDGCGIEQDFLEKIYEPFYTTKKDSTGLGLGTVLGIVKQNGGYITIDTDIGKGTSFYVYLPRAAAADKQLEKPKQRNVVSEAEKVILVVDDDSSVLELLEPMLSAIGYKSMTADNPLKAIDLFKKNNEKIMLLLTDFRMPDMDGAEMAMEMLKWNPQLKVVIMSGFGGEIMSDDPLKGKTYNFIGKPFTIKQLEKTIKELLDN